MSESYSKPDALERETLKRKTYERLCDGVPDAVVILARDVIKNEITGEMKSGSYGNVDIHGLIGGAKARSIAGAELHRFFPDALVVTNSNIKTEPYSYARVTAGELEKRGVEREKMLIQENSYSTFTELIELVKLIVEHKWRHAAVVVNEFSIPRAQAMIEHIHELHDPNGYSKQPEVLQALDVFKQMSGVKIVFVAAEDVLLAADPHFKRVITEAKQLPAWKEVMEREQAGAQQIRDGEYWKNLPPTFVKQ